MSKMNHKAISRLPSIDPPDRFQPARVPQFAAFTFDDNGKSGLPGAGTIGGMSFVLDLFDSGRNQGSGEHTEHAGKKTFDYAATRATFLAAGFYSGPGQWENGSFVKKIWKKAADLGHEIGNHTYTHPHGLREGYSASKWEEEIMRCDECLTNRFDPNETPETKDDKNGIGLRSEEIVGFRAPFLGYNAHLFPALSRLDFSYDCSISEGFQGEQDGTNCFWPYTLDLGSPGDRLAAIENGREPAPGVPGLWELPTYAVTVPPDELCRKYGVQEGLRTKLAKRVDTFNENDGKIDGLDWNLWSPFEMNADEFIATFAYSLDLKYKGNRAPMIFCFHSDIYADEYDDPMPNADAGERRRALKACYEYAAGLKDARLVTMKDLVSWLENPVPLR